MYDEGRVKKNMVNSYFGELVRGWGIFAIFYKTVSISLHTSSFGFRHSPYVWIRTELRYSVLAQAFRFVNPLNT